MNKRFNIKFQLINSNLIPVNNNKTVNNQKNKFLNGDNVPDFNSNQTVKLKHTKLIFIKNSKKKSDLINFNKESKNLNDNKQHKAYNTITYSSKSNIKHLNSFSSPLDNKLLCSCCCCPHNHIEINSFSFSKKESSKLERFYTPKKNISSNTVSRRSYSLNYNTEKKIIERKSNTLTNLKQVTNSDIKNGRKCMVRDNMKFNNLFKKIKIQQKVPDNGIIFRNRRNEEKIIINKFKKINTKKVKIDLYSVNDINSKKERIDRILNGIPFFNEKIKCELCHKMVDSYLYKFHYHSHPSQIFNWLYLGTFRNANNNQEIKKIGINYILNCAIEIHLKNLPNYIKYCHLNLVDDPSIDIIQYFEQAFSFIELARKKKQKILIHCKLGISRSPAILIGYLIKHLGHTTASALNFIKSKRVQIHPNSGFINQLNLYERSFKKNQRKNYKIYFKIN